MVMSWGLLIDNRNFFSVTFDSLPTYQTVYCFFKFYEVAITGHKPVLVNAIHDVTESVHGITHSRERPRL